jgi:hypothetical protein
MASQLRVNRRRLAPARSAFPDGGLSNNIGSLSGWHATVLVSSIARFLVVGGISGGKANVD